MHPVQFHITKDGSHSLYSETFNQYYHNPNGAIEESIHVFFKYSGILDSLKQNAPVSIFETGFGTGLNLLLLLDFIQKTASTSEVRFESVEAWPISPDQASQLNHSELIGTDSNKTVILDIFKQLQTAERATLRINNCSVVVHKCLFNELKPVQFPFTHFFHDAFSPEVNPELWTPYVFEKLLNCGTSDSILVTYGASTAARAAMAFAGWKIARAPGALGKREMTVASPTVNHLGGLDVINNEKLIRRWEKGDFVRK